MRTDPVQLSGVPRSAPVPERSSDRSSDDRAGGPQSAQLPEQFWVQARDGIATGITGAIIAIGDHQLRPSVVGKKIWLTMGALR